MSFYFEKFPTVQYFLPIPRTDGVGSAVRSTKSLLATDISTRFIIKQIVGDPNLIYYDYEVKDGERPDIIAAKYYGDARLDWLLMFFNQIHDPYFGWPLSTKQFQDFIIQKFGSIATAQSTIFRYDRLIRDASEYSDGLGNTITIPAKYVEVDESTYNALPMRRRRTISNYGHENHLNEQKRKIKILDEEFVPELMKTYRTYFDNG